MPKGRKQDTAASVTVADADPWQAFLEALHLVGGITVESEAPSSQVPGEAKVLSDPLFPKFLELLSSDWGQGPGSISNFQKLPQDEKLFYLGAFQIWKENLKKKNIRVQV
jgi:hypothetical protein